MGLMYDLVNGNKLFKYDIRNKHTHKVFYMFFATTKEIRDYLSTLDPRHFEVIDIQTLEQERLEFDGEG